ncbi:hypothetical protein [Mucilaginibacter lacusdianchii]|uniref:hypothetical protein n=1 Tax=Mucilaginibacter lacusdianchii TaxID=2684211 RepID=UPI00131C4A59|nr:hypothetical protein [Mucilaginibacter sp. JXJ CY 39]
MKKNYAQFLSLLLAALGISILSSCHFGEVKGSGHRITETRKVDDFTKIELSGGYNVKLKQDNSYL